MNKIIAALVFWSIIACTNEPKVIENEEHTISNAPEVGISEVNEIKLDLDKNVLQLPIIDSIDMDTIKEDCIFDKETWLSMGLDKVEAYKEDASTYHLISKVVFENQKMYLIGRAFNSENVHWLVLLNEKNKLITHLQTAYNNAEGFLTMQTVISKQEVVVKTWNDFSEEKYKEEKYRIKKDALVKL